MTQHGQRDQSHDRRPAPIPSREPPVALTCSVREAAALLGVNKKLLYALIAQDRSPVPFLRLGRRVIRIPRAALERLLYGAQGQERPT